MSENKRTEQMFLPKYRKAAIGTAITWMIATMIIVFLISIFLIFMVGIKIIDKKDISLEEVPDDVENPLNKGGAFLVIKSIIFLDSGIFINNENIQIKKALMGLSLIEDKDKIDEYRSSLRNKINQDLGMLGDVYYFLDVKYEFDETSGGGDGIDLKTRSFKVADIYDMGAPDHSLPYYVFKNINTFYLFSENNEKIEVRLYIEEK